MGNKVLVMSQADIKKMQEHYENYVAEKLPPGSIFSAKMTECVITAYKSGKVLFQGKNAEAEAAKWNGTEANKASTIKKKPVHQYAPPKDISSLSIIGSDEVGTGDYFGPIVVCAAYVDKKQLELLQTLGVKDSKDLKDNQIIEIAKTIEPIITYSLLVLHNEKYNKLQQSGMTQGKMKALLHNQAINHVIEKIKPTDPEGILIDQFVQPDIYFNHIRGKEIKAVKEKMFFSTKAEGIHLSVAAASIIARYAFVQHFEQLSKKAGFTLPKGAGFHVDEAAAKLILKRGKSALNQFTKLHFANTGKAEELVRKKLHKQ